MPAHPARAAFVPLAMLLLCAGCGSAKSPGAGATPSPGPSVATVTAASGVIYPTIQIAGVITPYRQVGVAADLTEPFVDVDVQEGDRVRAGQVLAHLLTDDLQAQLVAAQRTVAEDVAHYAQLAYETGATNAQDESAIRSAQQTLRQAQVNLSGASVDLQRYEGLEAQGYLAPQTVDQQRTTVASDTAAVNSAQASLDQAIANAKANGQGTNAGEQAQELAADRAAADAAQASVEQLKRQIARATIVAPVDGVVDAVNANPGEYPSARELFTIEQISQVYALLPTSSEQVAQIQTGAAATIEAAGSTRTDHGTVSAVLDELQPGTTNFTVKVLVPNADGHLRAGMPVTGVVSQPAVRGIEIPVTAFIDDTHANVYAVVDGIVRTTNVHEVRDDGTTAVVTGLAAGTLVIRDVESVDVGNGDRVTTGSQR
jgi:multidrug efflux pump subunit AcrA (membrane-fusion protein)